MVSGSKVLDQLLAHQHPFCVGTVCMRREALLEAHVDMRNVESGEDWLLWCHLAIRGHFAPAGDRVVMYRRWHDGNISHKMQENAFNNLEIHRRVFSDQCFRGYLGETRWHELNERYHSIAYMFLAGKYAEEGNVPLAQEYMDKVTVPLSEIKRSLASWM